MSRLPIIIVTGIPGAGKTTVARALAERFDRGVHIEADVLQRLIVRGALWPDQEPHEEALRQLELRAHNVAAVARNFYDAGFTVVIDDVIVGPQRLEIYEQTLTPRPRLLIVLAPPLAVALERARTRGHQAVGDRWAHLDAEQRAQLGARGHWLDTGALSSDETVELIITNLLT